MILPTGNIKHFNPEKSVSEPINSEIDTVIKLLIRENNFIGSDLAVCIQRSIGINLLSLLVNTSLRFLFLLFRISAINSRDYQLHFFYFKIPWFCYHAC